MFEFSLCFVVRVCSAEHLKIPPHRNSIIHNIITSSQRNKTIYKCKFML